MWFTIGQKLIFLTFKNALCKVHKRLFECKKLYLEMLQNGFVRRSITLAYKSLKNGCGGLLCGSLKDTAHTSAIFEKYE